MKIRPVDAVPGSTATTFCTGAIPNGPLNAPSAPTPVWICGCRPICVNVETMYSRTSAAAGDPVTCYLRADALNMPVGAFGAELGCRSVRRDHFRWRHRPHAEQGQPGKRHQHNESRHQTGPGGLLHRHILHPE